MRRVIVVLAYLFGLAAPGVAQTNPCATATVSLTSGAASEIAFEADLSSVVSVTVGVFAGAPGATAPVLAATIARAAWTATAYPGCYVAAGPAITLKPGAYTVGHRVATLAGESAWQADHEINILDPPPPPIEPVTCTDGIAKYPAGTVRHKRASSDSAADAAVKALRANGWQTQSLPPTATGWGIVATCHK